MNIILSILQILGIVLLVVIGVAVLLIVILLFHPLFYKAEGELRDTKWVKGRFSWLFHLVHGRMSYEDELFYGELFILGKRVKLSKDISEVNHSTMHTEDTSDEEWTADIIDHEKTTDQDMTKDTADDIVTNDTVTQGSSSEENLTGNPKLIERLKRLYRSICNKFRMIRDTYPRIKKIITDKQNHQALIHLKDELVYLIKILLPKKSSVRGTFSTGSPDTTGQLFGFMAIFPLIYTDGWSIVPDFQAEKAYFEGVFRIKGRIYLYQLVGIVMRIVLDKNCRRMYAMIQSFENFIKKRKVQEDK